VQRERLGGVARVGVQRVSLVQRRVRRLVLEHLVRNARFLEEAGDDGDAMLGRRMRSGHVGISLRLR
jgi:hypothetical protein